MTDLIDSGLKVFFLDDNYEEYDGKVAYCYGGYFYRGNLKELYDVIATFKINNGLKEEMPIKWDFSGQLEKFYKEYCNVNDIEWKKIKLRSKELRVGLVREISSIKILFSVFFDEKGHEYVRNWMIENLFQRIGLNMEKESLNLMVCDYEHHKSKAKKVLEEEYFNAYHSAKQYYSGPLKRRGAFPSLTYSSTYFNPFLQVSDIIVGCMGNLVRSYLKSESPNGFVKEFFEDLRNKFDKNKQTGTIFKYGIVSNNKDFYNFLESI